MHDQQFKIILLLLLCLLHAIVLLGLLSSDWLYLTSNNIKMAVFFHIKVQMFMNLKRQTEVIECPVYSGSFIFKKAQQRRLVFSVMYATNTEKNRHRIQEE